MLLECLLRATHSLWHVVKLVMVYRYMHAMIARLRMQGLSTGTESVWKGKILRVGFMEEGNLNGASIWGVLLSLHRTEEQGSVCRQHCCAQRARRDGQGSEFGTLMAQEVCGSLPGHRTGEGREREGFAQGTGISACRSRENPLHIPGRNSSPFCAACQGGCVFLLWVGCRGPGCRNLVCRLVALESQPRKTPLYGQRPACVAVRCVSLHGSTCSDCLQVFLWDSDGESP